MGEKTETDTPERPRHAPHRLEASSGPPSHRSKPPAASQLSVSSSARPSLPPLGPPARHLMLAQQRLQPPTKPPCHQPAPQTATGECASLRGPIGPLDTAYTAPAPLLRCCTAPVAAAEPAVLRRPLRAYLVPAVPVVVPAGLGRPAGRHGVRASCQCPRAGIRAASAACRSWGSNPPT